MRLGDWFSSKRTFDIAAAACQVLAENYSHYDDWNALRAEAVALSVTHKTNEPQLVAMRVTLRQYGEMNGLRELFLDIALGSRSIALHDQLFLMLLTKDLIHRSGWDLPPELLLDLVRSCASFKS